MSPAIVTCPSCFEPLPEGARFCPSCGNATPVSVNTATREVVPTPRAMGEEGSDHRARLQHALGEGLKIRRLLGRGGFAEVWSAFDVRLKREVAVKTLRYDLVISDSLLQRFQREAEAVAKLRHPNIIPIYEVGEGEGIAYFVMPMIEGESLGEALDREGPFSVEEACRILRESAEALAAAHRAGIVHRDIKPDNIMLEGPERRPILMDFGIAKATTGADAHLTGTGMAMGTPHYMSPEQASGERNLDARSDEYALALVGYRMLAGRSPFEADTMASLMMKQITEVPKPLSSVRSDVPRALSDALARALAKDPAGRFQSMEDFAAAIPRIGVASGASSGKRRPTQTELARFPGAVMPTWRAPLMLLGVVAIVATIVSFEIAKPTVAIATAAKRDDALFTGRAFLTKQGALGSYSERLTLAQNETTYAWLEQTLGTRAADDRVAADGNVVRWDLRWDRKGPGDSSETWIVGIAPTGKIASFNVTTTDTSPGKTIPADSAASIAERFIRDAGVDLAGYTRMGDSLVPRSRRTDHVFTWDKKSAPIVGAHGDTAVSRVRVTIAGDRVSRFRVGLAAPARFVRAVRSDIWRNISASTVALVWAFLVIAAIIVAVQRQRTDELQWKAALRLSIAALLVVGVEILLSAENILEGGPAIAIILLLVFVGAIIACGLIFGVVSGESLANELNPPALVGFDSLARFRFSTPEWPAALLRGLAIGAIFAAVKQIGSAVAVTFAWRAISLPSGVNTIAPWSVTATTVGTAVVFAIIVFFAVHLLLRWTKQPWLAILVPGLVYALMGNEPTVRPWMLSSFDGAAFAILCWTVWRYGFLTAAVAAWVGELLPVAIGFLAIGNGRYLTAGSVTVVALVAVPLVAVIMRARGGDVVRAR